MAFYFFTDIDSLNVQGNIAFGPASNTTINSVDYEQFLVTSKHTAVSDTDAIAVCKGQIFVQEQSTNASLLNIVFNPMDTQPFDFPKIKYFIYKGIRKDSLIAQNNTDIAAKGTSDLVDSIWTSFEQFNNTGIPPKTIVGLQPTINTLADNTPLEDVFSTMYTDVQFWTVKEGSTLGKFDQSLMGFEVVLDTLFYKPALELARNTETYIRAKILTASPLQKDFFEHWHDKEAILNFIDPCAFFGGFYNTKLSVISGGQISKWFGEDLYNNLIVKFYNKNKCYIDIRNEFNFSLNYFKNYGLSPTNNITNIKIRKGETAAVVTEDYYNNDWPIYIIDAGGFSITSANNQLVSLQLPAGNGDNPAPLIYFGKAFTPYGFPAEFERKEKFRAVAVTGNYCEEIIIAVPWANGNLLCAYIQLKYCKQVSNEVLPIPLSTQIRKMELFDCLFSPAMNFDITNSSFKFRLLN